MDKKLIYILCFTHSRNKYYYDIISIFLNQEEANDEKIKINMNRPLYNMAMVIEREIR